jgi:hypothetical protein
VRRRRPLTWEVPAVTAVVAAVAAVGPLSVVDLSIRSQSARLEQVLDRVGVRSRVVLAEPPATPVEIDPDDYDEAAERIRVLAALGGAEAVERVLGGNTEQCAFGWSGQACLAHLGVTAAERNHEGLARTVYAHGKRPLEVAGLRGLEVHLADTAGAPAVMDHMSLRLSGGQLVMDLGDGHTAAADLSSMVDEWYDTNEVGAVPPLRDAAGCARGHFLPGGAQVERAGDGHRLAALQGLWLVPIAPDCR